MGYSTESVEKVLATIYRRVALAAEATATTAKPAQAGFAKSAQADFAGVAAVLTARQWTANELSGYCKSAWAIGRRGECGIPPCCLHRRHA